MPQVELVYDDECPNVTLARTNLRHAFSLVGLTPSWVEHRIGADGVPAHARGYGSPTILVDGLDVALVQPGTEACCRIYENDGRFVPAPQAELIAQALGRSLGA